MLIYNYVTCLDILKMSLEWLSKDFTNISLSILLTENNKITQ